MEIDSEGSCDKEWTEEESKKASRKPFKNFRRFQIPHANNGKKMATLFEDAPDNYEELEMKTDTGTIPETIYYRPTCNSMYIPTITAEMLQDDGSNLTLQTDSEEYFKYARARQTTKNEHADPVKVFQIIDAVRKRPIIWDQRLICHQNSTLIRRAWQQLDIELGLDEEYPLARRKQIWKSKKDYYCYAYNTDSLGKWIFVNAFDFYEPMINFRTRVCLRPSVSMETDEKPWSSNLYDKLILADKNVQCNSLDKNNVMTLVLRSLFDVETADIEMMEKHGKGILDIFENNQQSVKKTGLNSVKCSKW